MPQCHYCKKLVCTNCSNRDEPGGGSSKVRICHVCKVNRSNRQGEVGELEIGKPKDFKKVLNVQHDNKTGEYTGLPQIWRELLDMPLSHSKQEIDTSKWDPSIAPVQPNKRQMYIIQEKNAEGAFMISAPLRVEKAFAVKFDYKLGKLVGLPKELEPYAEGFKPEDFNNNPQDVMDAMEAARKLAEE
jgi:hypothetical protein